MLLDLFMVVLGVGILYVGAEGLVRGSVSMALRLGLTPMVIGLTVVAFGTSAPEAVVSIRAAVAEQGSIAMGNVVGSNISNIGLILALSVLIRPALIKAQTIRFDLPVLMLATVVLVGLAWDGHLGRITGALLFAGLLVFLYFSVVSARREHEDLHLEMGEALPAPTRSVFADISYVLVGLALLAIGAHVLVAGAVDIALSVGMSQAVIGLTIVAVGTSLPELATSLLAASKGEGDLAVGNILGSNLFNILGVLGMASLAKPLISTGITYIDLTVLAGFTLILLPLAITQSRLDRWEGGVLLVAYVGYITYLLV